MFLNGFTPLIYAVLNNHFNVVQYLIHQGANVNANDSSIRVLFVIELLFIMLLIMVILVLLNI